MSTENLFDIDEIKKVKLDPDDIIVLKYPCRLTTAMRWNLETQLATVLPNKVIILEEGMDMAIIEKGDIDAG